MNTAFKNEMPPRRERMMPDARRAQIIAGAFDAFASKGYSAATNKDIAEAARLTAPGLIYHYFKDREELLLAVVETYLLPLKLVANPDERQLLFALPLETGLRRIAAAFLDTINQTEIASLLRIVLTESIQKPELAQHWADAVILRTTGLVANYLERQGALGQTDPNLAATRFLGPFIALALQRIVFRLPGALAFERDAVIEEMVTGFLHGLQNVN